MPSMRTTCETTSGAAGTGDLGEGDISARITSSIAIKGNTPLTKPAAEFRRRRPER